MKTNEFSNLYEEYKAVKEVLPDFVELSFSDYCKVRELRDIKTAIIMLRGL